MWFRSAKVPAALAALILAAAPHGVPAQSDPTQMLRDAVNAYAKYSYVGQVQSVDFGAKRAEAVLFRIEHRAPDLTRRWYLAPESLYGNSIVSRGDVTYDIDSHAKRVIFVRDDALDDQVALDDNFGLLLRNYRAVMGPDDTMAGRRVHDVLLVNKYTGQTVMRIGLDAQTNLVLEKDLFAASGSVTNQMHFEQIRYTGAIPVQLFDVPTSGYARVEGQSHGAPSADFQALARTAGFQVRSAKYLPEGFVPIAGDVSDVKGVRTLHLLYSDGLRTVSLFQNARGAPVDMSRYTEHSAKVRSHDARYVEDGPTTLLAWAQGNLHFALVGELSRNELIRIASSIAP